MPWLVSVRFIDVMVQEAKLRDPAFTAWWRDEAALAAWWQMLELPEEVTDVKLSGAAVVPDGGLCCLITRIATDATNGEATWTLLAIIPAGLWPGGTWLPNDQLCPEGVKWPKDWITKYRTPGVRLLMRKPVKVGDWIGARSMLDNSGVFGRCLEIDEAGRAIRVQVDPDGTVYQAQLMSKAWFTIQNRDEACADLFAQGLTQFPAYINMLARLAKRQKKLVGDAYVQAPKIGKHAHPAKKAAVEAQEKGEAAAAARKKHLAEINRQAVTMYQLGISQGHVDAWIKAEVEAYDKKHENLP